MTTEIQREQTIVPFDARRNSQISTLNSFRELAAFLREIAETAFAAGMVPPGIRNVEGALTAIWRGAEVGLLPQQALQDIYIVNGTPHLYGDAPKGIVESSGLMEDCEEKEEGTFPEDTYKWICTVKRRGHSKPRRSEFSILDAKTAKLWGKVSDKGVASTWVLYPKRMLLFRARGYALRDEFSDVLKGFPILELKDDDDALFQAAKPAVGHVVEPKIEGAKRGPGRPRTTTQAPTAPPAVEPTPAEPPKPEAPAEPPVEPPGVPPAEPPAGILTEGLTPGGRIGPETKTTVFAAAQKVGPAVKVRGKLFEAGHSEVDFLKLITHVGLLKKPANNLDEVPEQPLTEALGDWDNVLEALKQKVWEKTA